MTSSHHNIPRRGATGSRATRHAEMVSLPVDIADGQSTRPDHVALIYPVKHSFGPRLPAGRWVLT
jgi:hypothetical protein